MKTSKIPSIYDGNIHDPANTRRILMEDVNLNLTLSHDMATLERLESYESLIKPMIGFLWQGFEDFCAKVNKQTLLARHEQLFGACPPKKQPLIDTQLQVWHKLCNTAKNKLISSIPKAESGRVSKILATTYTQGSLTSGYGDITTFQAKVCVDIFRECITNKQSITEEELRNYVTQHQARIKTRQEPWRIFQYYRTKMITNNILKRQ